MANRYLIKVSGIDMTDWIREFPGIPIRKGELGSLIEIPSIQIQGDNTEHVWTPGHTSSILDADWVGEPVEVWEFDILIFEGELANISIQNDGRVAVIDASSKINRLLGTQIFSFASDQQTFAELSERIYLGYGVDVDSLSYTIAKDKQEDLLFQARANINIVSNLSVLSAQQWLANAGMCRHYFIGNIAYMQFIDPSATIYSMHTFDDSEIMEVLDYSLVQRQAYDGYEIQTAVGTARKIGSNPVPSLVAAADNPFVVSTLQFGFNWGDNQETLSQGDKYHIQIHLAAGDWSSWLGLTSYFRIESDQLGVNKTFEVLGIDNSSQLGPIIEGESI